MEKEECLKNGLTEKDNKSIASGGVDVGLNLKMSAFNIDKAVFSPYQ